MGHPSVLGARLIGLKMPLQDCGASLVAFFPPEIYNFVGSSAVLPELLQSLDQRALSTVQFLQNGAVRVTFKTRLPSPEVVTRPSLDPTMEIVPSG